MLLAVMAALLAPTPVGVGEREWRISLYRSRDGRWYLFTKATGRWAMAAPPEDDVDDLLDHDLRS